MADLVLDGFPQPWQPWLRTLGFADGRLARGLSNVVGLSGDVDWPTAGAGPLPAFAR